MTRVREGKAAGPFRRPPFPNAQCPQQAVVVKDFSIPKDKWNVENEAIRICTNLSFPAGLSVNDLTPRSDDGVQYYTFGKFVAKIVKAGRGAWVVLADVPDAYKQLAVQPSDLWQQVKRVFSGDGTPMYFVELCGLFGGKYAADNWNRFMSILTAILASQGVAMDFYVDNLDGVHSRATDAVLQERRLRILAQMAGIPLHEISRGQSFKHLGWQVDTVRWLLQIAPSRLPVVKAGVKALQESSTKDQAFSFIGWFASLDRAGGRVAGASNPVYARLPYCCSPKRSTCPQDRFEDQGSRAMGRKAITPHTRFNTNHVLLLGRCI